MSFFLRKSIKSNGVYLQICETVYNKETKSSSNKNYKIIGYADSYNIFTTIQLNTLKMSLKK
ncbi:MAG: hypothetical protein PUJ83_03085 [Bacilli bacterium]|nr:hypothetical protein [Bacilli bacterium]MDY5899019.1 hypothetical protein [Bacilli bacterium]